jgi:hypothetical protein
VSHFDVIAHWIERRLWGGLGFLHSATLRSQ